jgi:hypothetical protein
VDYPDDFELGDLSSFRIVGFLKFSSPVGGKVIGVMGRGTTAVLLLLLSLRRTDW